VSFHTFPLSEDRCVRLLLKNVGKRMPEAEIKEELQALTIIVQAVMQLRSKRRDQDPEKDRPLTPHFVVSVARGPEVTKVRSVTELCVLRVQVETYIAPKGPLQCKRCQGFGHTQRNCGYAPRCMACGDRAPVRSSVPWRTGERCITTHRGRWQSNHPRENANYGQSQSQARDVVTWLV
jgi:hypothetical protein